ncbi:MAG: cation diffusion facilitator family transporter [Candidatus Hermodarchaeota archaeon]
MKQDRKVLLAEGEKVAFITLLCNIFLIIFKITTGVFIRSIALFASGLDALMDLIATLAVLFGLHYSQKEPSDRFPYGYYRMETLATLIVAIFILLFGLSVLIESIGIIITPSMLIQPVFGLLISILSALVAFALYRYNLKIGTKIASNALIGTAKEFQLDIFTNSFVFLGILAYLVGFPQLEGFVGLMISFLIIKTGLEFGRTSLLILLDAIDDPDIIEQIRSIVTQFPQVQKVSNIRIRRSGPYYFADIEIQMLATKTVKSLTHTTHQLESSLKEKLSQLDSIMISVEPIEKTKFKVAIAVSSLDTNIKNIPTEHFGLASAFLLADIDISSQTINTSQLVENPHKKAERKRGILGAKFLVNKGIDVLVIKDIGTFGVGPKAILTENNILLYQVWGETIQEILEGFLIYHSEAK